MRSINFIHIVWIALSFLFVSFSLGILSVQTIGSVLVNIIPADPMVSVYLSGGIAVVLAGLITGKVINTFIKELPLYHSVAVAVIVGILIALWPQSEDGSLAIRSGVIVLSLLSIIYGAYVYKSA